MYLQKKGMVFGDREEWSYGGNENVNHLFDPGLYRFDFISNTCWWVNNNKKDLTSNRERYSQTLNSPKTWHLSENMTSPWRHDIKVSRKSTNTRGTHDKCIDNWGRNYQDSKRNISINKGALTCISGCLTIYVLRDRRKNRLYRRIVGSSGPSLNLKNLKNLRVWSFSTEPFSPGDRKQNVECG